MLLGFFDVCSGATVLIAGRVDGFDSVFFDGRLTAVIGILALNILDFSPSAWPFGKWVAGGAAGDIFENRYFRYLKTVTVAMTTINRTRPADMTRRSRQRFRAVELTTFFASTDSGRAGNASGGGDCPSILFKALRIELNGVLLQSYWVRYGISNVFFSR
jgi:hypothetical protein